MQLFVCWLLGFLASCYFLVATRLCFLDPSLEAFKVRLVFRPHIKDWLIHLLAKSGPDLLLVTVMIFRGEDGKAVGKTHGAALNSLLLLPGISRILLPSVVSGGHSTVSLRFRMAATGFVVCSVFLAVALSDGQMSVWESRGLLGVYAVFQAGGMFASVARPDPVETEMLVFQQVRALGTVGVFLLPTNQIDDGVGNFEKFPGRGILGKLMFATPVGSSREHLAPVAVSLAFFWIFVFSLVLDETTSQLATLVGISDQQVGLTLVALASKLPRLLSAVLKRQPISVSADSLDNLSFASSAALAVPWLLVGGTTEKWQPARLALVGCGLSVGALALSLWTKSMRGVQVGGILCGAWLGCQMTYLWLSRVSN